MRRGQRSFARDLGWTDVIVEGDCSQGLSAIQNRVEDLKLSYGALVSQLLHFSCSFNYFATSFVKRSGNRLAHALAHLSLNHLDVLEELTLPPDLPSII